MLNYGLALQHFLAIALVAAVTTLPQFLAQVLGGLAFPPALIFGKLPGLTP